MSESICIYGELAQAVIIDITNINEYHERVNRVCDSLKSGTGSAA